MKIIGVTGKSGVGKSTLSNFLGERANVGVIHLDDIFNNIKENKFKNQIKGRNKDNSPRILSDRLRISIANNILLFKISMFLKKILMKKKIEEQLKAFKTEGKDAVIIEGIHLKYMTDYRMFDRVIYVRRPYEAREKALLERDAIPKSEIIERDLPYRKKFSSEDWKNFDYIVDNIEGEEQLRAISQRIYNEVVGIRTFDDRYAVTIDRLMPMSRNLNRGFRKVPKVIERSREAN